MPMLDFIKNEARKKPHLILDRNRGLIELKGSSFMEDVIEFYDPVLEWVYDYIRNPKDTVVNIDLEFFNSSSAKVILILIKALAKISKSGHILIVNWYYDEDDEDIRESGCHFSTMSNVNFNLIEKKRTGFHALISR